jgi:hypothetical protein
VGVKKNEMEERLEGRWKTRQDCDWYLYPMDAWNTSEGDGDKVSMEA